MSETLIYVENLKKYFPILSTFLRRKVAEVKAVDSVTLKIFKGECFGLVGESGCGKTTLGKTTIRLYKPTAGSVYFKAPPELIEKLEKEESHSPEIKKLVREYDVAFARGSKLKELRRKMQIVYQDPVTSLNPRMLVKDIVGEPLKVHGLAKGSEARNRVIKILESVGLSERHLYRYPHEFSGGQRQRIAVARALITNPEFVILDEPTSAVDVSVRAQLLNLFVELQKKLDLTYVFISHDLSIVECISHRVAVMYLGKIVEAAQTGEIFKEPLHPYAISLISSVPVPDPTVKRVRAPLKGDVPSPVNPPVGCRFHPRCPKVMDICHRQEPELIDVGKGHLVACHLYTK